MEAPPLRPLLSRRALLALGIAWAALMGAWAALDLPLSRAIADHGSRFGAFVADVGELPGALLAFLAVAVAGAARSRGGTPQRERAAFLAFVLLGALPLAYFIGAPLTRLQGFGRPWVEAHATWLATLSVGLSLAFQLAFEHFRPPVSPAARRWAWLTIGLGVLLLVVVATGLKLVWGRFRLYELDPTGAAFTPWYLPQGFTGHHSFPSGHTAWAWMGLPLLALVADASRRTRAWVTGAVVAWGIAVAVGRVRYGAHFASDVTFSSGAAVFLMAWIDLMLRRSKFLQSPRAKPTSAEASAARSASASTSSSGKPTTTD